MSRQDDSCGAAANSAVRIEYLLSILYQNCDGRAADSFHLLKPYFVVGQKESLVYRQDYSITLFQEKQGGSWSLRCYRDGSRLYEILGVENQSRTSRKDKQNSPQNKIRIRSAVPARPKQCPLCAFGVPYVSIALLIS